MLKNTIISALSFCLTRSAKKSLMHLSYHLAPAEFASFAHIYCIAPNVEMGLQSLATRKFSPRSIIDVGAYEGNWSIAAKGVWPVSNTIMIEPNLSKYTKLMAVAARLDATIFTELLGARDGEPVQFHLMETGSSIMSERSNVARAVETRNLVTLDSLPIVIDAPAMLKIDAQGYELEILRGATKTLINVEVVLLEVAIIEINKGAPLLYNVVAFMNELNFVACEIFELHRRPLDNALSQVDIVFARRGSVLLNDQNYN